MQFCKETFLSCPVSIPPLGGIYSQLGIGRESNLSFNSRTHHKRPNAYGQFTQFNIRTLSRNGIINCCSNSDSTANAFAMYATNDHLGAYTHCIDHIGETTEEFKSLGLVFYRYKFFK